MRGRSAPTFLLVLALVGAGCQSGGGGQTHAASEETRLEQARREYPGQVAGAVLIGRIPAPEGFDGCVSGDLGEERFGELRSGSPWLEVETDVAALCLLELGVAPGSLQEAAPVPVTEPEAQIGPRPVLENLGVDIGPWNPKTNMAGEFLFTNDMANVDPEYSDRVFFEFPNGGWMYYLPVATDIVAVSDGVVDRVCWQEGQYADGGPYDYAVVVVPAGTPDAGVVWNNECEIVRGSLSQGTRWMISYDHLLDVTVKEGDVVRAGDVIGKPGNLQGHSSLGRFEIEGPIREQITGQGFEQRWYCPLSFFEPSLRAQYESLVTQLMTDWEGFRGNPDIYDEQSHVAPGCSVERINPANYE